MDSYNTRNLMVANIVAGILSNPNVFEMYKDETFDGALLQDCVVRDANIYVDKILGAKQETKELEHTGLYDRDGHELLNGDIFVYLKYETFKCGDDGKQVIPSDLITNFKKYEDSVSLHPVFWDRGKKCWCSDVYGDADAISTYNPEYIVVVSNKIEHPELYNY